MDTYGAAAAIDKYYQEQVYTGRGAGPYYKGSTFQRGRGLGGVLSAIGRFIAPALKTGGKFLARHGVKTAANIASDMLDGQSGSTALKRNTARSLEAMKHEGLNKIRRMVGYKKPVPPKKRGRTRRAGRKRDNLL